MYKDTPANIFEFNFSSLQSPEQISNYKNRTGDPIARISNMYYKKKAIYGEVTIYSELAKKLIYEGYEFKFLSAILSFELKRVGDKNQKTCKELKECVFIISFDPIDILETE